MNFNNKKRFNFYNFFRTIIFFPFALMSRSYLLFSILCIFSSIYSESNIHKNLDIKQKKLMIKNDG
jgi:hypothetical protein